ncbi:MAG: TraC family protein [Minisyncoccia bacterium]
MATASTATQAFVPLKEIREGVVVLKDGGYRGILMCSSVNFGLKSAEEQRGIIEGFRDFLNTLDFSIQIVVNSRKMDLRPYLALLQSKEAEQKTELLRIQLREYVDFIRGFAEQANIMTKTFYIVVPFAASGQAKVEGALSFLGKKPRAVNPAEKSGDFEEARLQLAQRMDLVAGGLSGTGVRAAALGTEEVIELLYRSFNPGELENPIRLEQ